MLQLIKEIAHRDAVLVRDERLQAEGFGTKFLLPTLQEFLRLAVLRTFATLTDLFAVVAKADPPVVAASSFVDASVAAHKSSQGSGHVVRKSSSETVATAAPVAGSLGCRCC